MDEMLTNEVGLGDARDARIWTNRLEVLYSKLLYFFMLGACATLLVMMLMICADVFLRNVPIIPGLHGLVWSNEIAEDMLYLITLLPAPWLMHQSQHIRVDILLHMLPKRIAWCCEWLTDVLALACCTTIIVFSIRALIESYESGSMTIKTLVTPEWWWLVPLPCMFFLLGVEMLFRMRRLYLGERALRSDFAGASLGTTTDPINVSAGHSS